VKSALLVIDVQNDYFSDKIRVTHPRGSMENILAAMDGAAKAGLPVITVQHSNPPEAGAFAKGSAGWQLHPEIARRKQDLLIEKTLPGSFTGTQLESWLRERGIDTLVITGYMPQMCCDTTSRQAVHLGFNVEFLSDATGTLAITNAAGSVTAEELHRAILVTQAMRFAKVLTTAQWLKSLSKQ
jgi:nicotinamidase-related amidase